MNSWAWNALAHRLIADIAYEHLTAHARETFDNYNNALNQVYKPESFVNSSVWLDDLSYKDIHWFSTMHYVDIPYSTDGSTLPPIQKINALWAIQHASKLLTNKYPTDFDKGIALRILVHVVGDIHQPLHAITRVSAEYPDGDKGGNQVLLRNNPIAKNLHAYWDRGAGLFVSDAFKKSHIESEAERLERKWPCSDFSLNIDPAAWAQESHRLAIQETYHFPIDSDYQLRAQQISEKRVVAAGCRLAKLLNQIDEQIIQKSIRKHHRRTKRGLYGQR